MEARLTHIGNHRIERELSRDARRVLYQGWQTSLTRPIQITLLTPEAAADAAFVERWKAIARDMKDPGHPGMPKILEIQFSGERFYLIESYVVGDTLADQAEVTRDLRAGLRLLHSLADVLAYAHRRSWAFGEITPGDVRIGADGNAYLIDLPWHAASRARGDPAAQRADARALGELFLAVMTPACGAAPPLITDPESKIGTLATWLAPASASEPALAAAAAPVIVHALDGAYPDCGALFDALRPLVQGVRPTPPSSPRVIEPTLIGPPPPEQPLMAPRNLQAPPTGGIPSSATSPSGAGPVGQGTPAPTTPNRDTTSGPKGGVIRPVVISGALLVLAILGVLLCRSEVLPFCVSCNKTLITEYLGAGIGYRTTGAWAEALREFEAAQAECDACRSQPAQCPQLPPLQAEAQCYADTRRLVAEATTLLDSGEACPALGKLEQAQKLGCEPRAAETLLVTGTEGRSGAYVSCSVNLLEQADQQTEPESREGICRQVHEYLGSARKLKPADPAINQRFTRAERYATLQTKLDAKDWAAAGEALKQLELVSENARYCGQDLKEIWFAVRYGQAGAAAQSSQWCEAWMAYQAAETAAQTLKQKGDAAKGVQETYARCSALWTPTPTPSPTPAATPTPTATPSPKASAKSDQANVRKGPYTSYQIATKAKAGEPMAVLCAAALSDGTWYEVKTAAGVTGWIRSDLVNLAGTPTACSSVPPPPPPAALCWFAQALPPTDITSNIFAIRMRTQDSNGAPIPRVRISISHESTNYSWVDETGPNGEVIRVGINEWRIKWHICIYSTKVCADTNAIKEYQRADIIFTRRPCQ